ncbi:MAG: PHP-associated domain-containing protein [Anaerolineae bacterium]
MGKTDLHIHSGVGDGMDSISDIFHHVEHHTDLDLIAITDHDSIEGAFQARDLAARGSYRFEVIVGMEITTLEGHLLAYDLQEPIRMLLPLSKTIRLIHRQGGFCIVPHPTSWLTRSIGRNGLRRIANNAEPEVAFDGIEVFNPSFAGKIIYEKALAMNEQWLHLPQCGGSDSHTKEYIGSAYTLFQGHTADDFRRSLRKGTTRAGGTFWTFEDHRRLARIAVPQVFKSWVILPTRHVRRTVDSLLGGSGR